MKILDPSTATLTLSEVHAILQSQPAHTPTVKSGAYEPVNLHDYTAVKADFALYLQRSAPHVARLLPAPASFVPALLARLRAAGIRLTKAEVLMLVDLGVGVVRLRPPAAVAAAMQDTVEIKNEDGTVGEEVDERDDYTILTAVVEEAEGRFTDDQLNEILAILREEMPLSSGGALSLVGASRKGDGMAAVEERQVSVPADSPASSTAEEGTVEAEAAAGIEDEAAEDDALVHEAGHQKSTGEGDIDGED